MMMKACFQILVLLMLIDPGKQTLVSFVETITANARSIESIRESNPRFAFRGPGARRQAEIGFFHRSL
jgi:hypothetical protein